jgi:hypothetical protein
MVASISQIFEPAIHALEPIKEQAEIVFLQTLFNVHEHPTLPQSDRVVEQAFLADPRATVHLW